MMTTVYLPPGWRTSIANDGRLYYINDATQKTQWNPPAVVMQLTMPYATTQQPQQFTAQQNSNVVSQISQFTIPSTTTHPETDTIQLTNTNTASTSNNPDLSDESQSEQTSFRKRATAKCKKVPWKPILFLIGLFITFSDFWSDLKVSAALHYISNTSLCSQFECAEPNDIKGTLDTQSRILIVIAVIGLLAELYFMYLKARTMYYVYRYPQEDHSTKTFEVERKHLKWGWITLIVEDFTSVLILILVSNDTKDIVGISGIYIKSIIFSLLSLSKGVGSTWFTRKKMDKSKTRYEELHSFEKAKKWHKRWSICLIIVMLIALGNIIRISVETYEEHTPWVDLYTVDSKIKSEYIATDIFDDNTTMSCTEYESNYTDYIGNLNEAPYFIYDGCNGSDYVYLLKCVLNKNDYSDAYILNCRLKWRYDIDDYWDTTGCNNDNNDICLFDIDMGICGDYTIHCNNGFSFYSGYPEMRACFDYCTKTLPSHISYFN